MLSTRYCHCNLSGHSRDIRNTTADIDQWKTLCCIYHNFLNSIKIKHFIYFILHVLSFDGIILSIKVV